MERGDFNVNSHLEKEKLSVLSKYTQLESEYNKESLTLKGTVLFIYDYKGYALECLYKLRIVVPNNFPAEWPLVYEVGGKVRKSFHVNATGSLCLGSSLRIQSILRPNPSLLNFIEKIVFPFLFSNEYFSIYRVTPFGELEHGGAGLYQDYQEILAITDINQIISFIEKLPNLYRGHSLCPCGSNKKLRNCHSSAVRDLLDVPSKALKSELCNLKDFSRSITGLAR
ncbi:MAG: hypothetical protein KDK39_09225 [Leptospiraceae bacterium]|nr:hypothetical protein [Leptospiraceae bacterium]